ncbi:ribonuclease H [Trifolium pratense]|uniref:Ribonuclease H n=1 Tax=Trifolium pratense TaxID=57577 RepID=A0A2K3KJ00_TRIPR|nr:ribonuclease H [Trifolium pratense]
MDRWRWISETTGLFSVKSAYCSLQNHFEPPSADPDLLEALHTLWKNDIPSKVGVFGWRLLLDKLPTRAALASKGILVNSHDLSCVFCFQAVENCHHLFFSCDKVIELWKQVFLWMGVEASLQVGGRQHFMLFGSLVKSKKGAFADFSGLLDQIKFISWLWFSGRAGRLSTPCTPY